MKTIIIILTLLSFSLVLSCDGRSRTFKTEIEVLKENKLLDSFSEKINYYPKTYTEVVTDTILNSGFKVKIKYWSDDNNMLTDSYETDGINHIDYYHEFNADIEIKKENQIIFSKTINKDFINRFSASKQNRINQSILQNIWLDELHSEEKKQLIIYLEYCEPKTDRCITYKLTADKKSHFTLKEH
jgi:hypothetical protein